MGFLYNFLMKAISLKKSMESIVIILGISSLLCMLLATISLVYKQLSQIMLIFGLYTLSGVQIITAHALSKINT